MNYDVYMTQAGDGFPVLWSHGATSSHAMEDDTPLIAWAQVSRIARVIRYDARGDRKSVV